MLSSSSLCLHCVGCLASVRSKKRSHSTAVGASLMSNKKVSSLVNKVLGTPIHVPGCMLSLSFFSSIGFDVLIVSV